MKKGFSLVELLIALSMSGMIFVAVSSLLVSLLSSNTKSRRQEVFEQVKNDLFVEFTNSVRWGGVVDYDGTTLTIDGSTYALSSGVINKNGEVLTTRGVEVTGFSVTPRSGVADLESYEIRVDMRDPAFNLSADVLSLVVSQRRTEAVEP